MESYLRNCMLQARPGDDCMFNISNGEVYARLDGYAILPREELVELQAIADLVKELLARSVVKENRSERY